MSAHDAVFAIRYGRVGPLLVALGLGPSLEDPDGFLAALRSEVPS